MKKIAIIGFGSAGYHAAVQVRKLDPDATIDIYMDTDLGPYNPMLTTYYVKGDIPYSALFPFGSAEQIAEEFQLNLHKSTPVTSLIPEKKVLCFADGRQVQYDQILISTGASAFMPPIEGIDLPGVVKMRTVQDAEKLKDLLDSGTIKTALVIGASWVGIKIVEDLVSYRIPCTLVDGAQWMFYVAAFEETAKRIHEDLERKGVSLAFGQLLSHIEQAPNGQLTAVMRNGQQFTADMVAVCIGVRMNVDFLRNCDLQINRGVITDAHMRTNYEGIYAAGDCCEAIDIQSGTPKNIGVWFNAAKQGTVAGINMAGGHAHFGGNVLVNLAHYLDYDFISIGDVSLCRSSDEAYEYESERYYIRAVRRGNRILCINMIGSACSNGLVKNAFIKSIENKEAGLDIASICYLKEQEFPDEFIDFLGGNHVD